LYLQGDAMKSLVLLGIGVAVLSSCGGGSSGNNFAAVGSLTHACESYYARLVSCGFYSTGHYPCQGLPTQAMPDEDTCMVTCQANATCEELENLACYWVSTGGMADCMVDCRKKFSFSCGNNGPIIPESWVCDDENDCADGSDEQGCPQGNGFYCPDGEKLEIYDLCDGWEDCDDGSDEQGCPSDSGFTCQDGEKIGADEVCDHWPDCEGGEDEDGCATPVHGCFADYYDSSSGGGGPIVSDTIGPGEDTWTGDSE